MGKNSKISWTHHTFNPWWGCVEVAGSGACAHCYAREFSKRLGMDLWGKDKDRKPASEHYWNDPLRWNKAAAAKGVHEYVFCASMGDVFEARPDLDAPRARLWKLIEATPNLIWLLLSKRPENFLLMTPWTKRVGTAYKPYGGSVPVIEGHWPKNVWPGVTCEDQRWAETRIPELLKVPASVHWISAEPLLGPIDFAPWLKQMWYSEGGDGPEWPAPRVDWVIVGGESGHGSRLMKPEWATDILAQCRANGAYYHFKQKGEKLAQQLGCKDKAGKDPSEWPEEFKVQEFPVLA